MIGRIISRQHTPWGMSRMIMRSGWLLSGQPNLEMSSERSSPALDAQK